MPIAHNEGLYPNVSLVLLEELQMSQTHNVKVEQSCSCTQTETKQGRLGMLVLKDGNLHLPSSSDGVPQLLIQANEALASGRVMDAARVINDEAVEAATQIINKDPSRTDIMLVLAMVFKQIGQFNKAKEWFEKILEQEPHALVYNELGFICQRIGHLSEAMEYQKRAVEADPNNAELLAGLARMHIWTGQIQEGINLFRQAIEIDPTNAAVHSNLLFYLHHQPELDPYQLFEEHRRWGRLHAPGSLARVSHDNNPDPERRLRVGYISPDFRVHPVAYFIKPLLDGHNHDAVEVYGYSNVAYPDEVTEQVKTDCDLYRNIRGLDDKMVVDMIQQDKIDILVELSGHTADNRLLVMAHKPAPIQVTYLGSPDTTGIEAIDYRFTDVLADPPESQQFYTEELFFLSDGFLCYKPADFAPPVAPLPALRNDYITFGSFNSSSKVHPHIIELWARILKANRDSRILLKFGVSIDHRMSKYYFSQFERLGISSSRVAICGWRPIDEHFRLYGEVDIALDTYPCNGFTTTCEALWAGVPVISLVGKCHASRVGLSMLSNVGLDFFAALTPDEYVAKATALAENHMALAQLRSSMRQRIKDGALYDAKRFARKVEAAYREMWHRWLKSA